MEACHKISFSLSRSPALLNYKQCAKPIKNESLHLQNPPLYVLLCNVGLYISSINKEPHVYKRTRFVEFWKWTFVGIKLKMYSSFNFNVYRQITIQMESSQPWQCCYSTRQNKLKFFNLFKSYWQKNVFL